MSSENDQIIAEFVVESREHMADIENRLLAIEAAGADIDEGSVNEVFRAVHSIKGGAGFLGLTNLGQLAHDMENVLKAIRDRELIPDSAVTDVALRAADALVAMLDDVSQSNQMDVSGHVAELRNITDRGPTELSETADTTADASESEVYDTPPATSADEIAANASYPADAIPDASPAEPTPPETLPQSAAPPDRREIQRRETTRRTADRRELDANIRVSVSVLDSLMNLAGELVLSRNQLLQAVGSNDGSGLDSVAARMDQVTSELQEAIMQTRMQAVGTVFNKFPRIVRDLSSQLGKECELAVEGKDVELDKSVIEAINDPLTHLVRNAIDHGVESPDARIRAGKSGVGTVVLRAFHQAGKVNISISDDGKGIDVAKLKEKAVSRGLITPEQTADMSDREALRLIFRPGFSMAAKVTDVSGRGVGMDVVKTNIEKLGGAVEIDTQKGLGTTIDVKLPLTLAIIPSLIVRCRDDGFAIPQANISELVRVKAQEVTTRIERVKNAEVFRLRGSLLPLVRLDAALELEPQPEEQEAAAINIIVVEAGNLRYGLVVDGLQDSEEIVVKPLGRHMQNCRCLAGATILGDGKVALILDVAGIASHVSLNLPDDDTLKDKKDNAAAAASSSHLMLLFTNGPGEHFAVAMEAVARLERIRSDQIDSVGGREVLQYRGGSLPLLTLERHIQAAPREELDKVHVVVFNVLSREVGMIVPHLIDISEVSANIDTLTLTEPGVVGSVLFDGNATRLLDLYDLTRAAFPNWFSESPAVKPIEAADDDTGAARILLAEDSDFFRKRVAAFIEDDGYEVVTCEDGLVAWNTLKAAPDSFALVVTDLEMPNLTGFELSQRIKDDPGLSHLPVIALTSLSSEEDIQRGKEAGLDDYHVKLDREPLLAAVASHMQAGGSQITPFVEHTLAPLGANS